MRLSTIKLAGFKSFVDPTTLHLPTNMTGVVGPNGCGKSNIIDAVRWVMGESSASRLRGDNLTDVIFSGSSGRKPVGTATVELIFDNSDHTIVGEYAQYNEISVKRMVSRDGASAYYLNGTRCRRRDITDLFLGTGLGPRSYSIIEQGMISQIIEARPEDLRVYLEEAAGISKYKERRKETETRMRHTRENLDRLNDLREEVDKQLEHLKRQARQAELYQQLRAEQRERDAQLKAMLFGAVERELTELRAGLGEEDLQLEATVTEQRHVEAQIELTRVQQGEAGEALSKVQAESYRLSSDIARVEQQIRHQGELTQRLRQSKAEADASHAEVLAHIEEDASKLADLDAVVQELEPAASEVGEQLAERAEALQAAERALSDWQRTSDAQRQAQSEAARAAEVERTRIDYLDRQMLELGRRRETLAGELQGLDVSAIEAALEDAKEQAEAQRVQVDELTAGLDARKQAVLAVQEKQRLSQAQLAEVRKEIQSQRGRLGSLEALQAAALGQEKGAVLDWLRAQGLEQQPRAGSVLKVQPGWETAVETVLGSLIEGVMVETPAQHAEALAALRAGRLSLLAEADEVLVAPADSLAAKIEGPAALRRLLVDVHAVDSLDAARARLPALAEGASLITREGEWLSAGFARVLRSGEAQQGALARERELQNLRAEIQNQGLREQALVEQLNELRDALQQAEIEREDAQRSLYLAHRSVAELSGQLQSLGGKLDQAQARRQRIEAELSQLSTAIEDAQEQAGDSRARLEHAMERMGEQEDLRLSLEGERERLFAGREAAQSAVRELRERGHHLALQLESKRSQRAGLEQGLARMKNQLQQLGQRRAELAEQLSVGDAPIEALKNELQVYLDSRIDVEKRLSAARSAVDGIEGELRNYEQRRQQLDQRALLLRERLSRKRLDEQALALKAQGLLEAITAAELEPQALLDNLPENATPETWKKSLDELETRIKRLEPVNLAAIQEYGEQSQRKEYLDSQHNDLTQALETLENAIRKIDKETRGRFKDTFDRVNTGVQALYPRLFGGGHAYLELTGEDLLDTGVAIMARPPGKRVSNISLLSGGEKALTAVALVFAIFQLNPAPFCLLDEVDAPLDEANVGRFSAMVSEMSEKVQFLFVTHNKSTMEAARQLAGVTMREPGVSRLVSVDIDEASRMVGAA
ncbi:chromosome segregation protein SMC [uncultured Aquimonas sp.]|uniref:chromosome segregation protein SMC n=1 Tax=uncultured Aquimonas sp. TaxID=385483 RepID=UPI00086F0119|nr:chromosome segregation protein SMC [uncultured Aquimonas sp.]ODU46732.1 MAG: chromosome segregation protein SMC [Xanthomonadaceae bacterium SCN 69-123]